MKPEEVLKEEYVALRAEICQSIAKQHQITLAGYGLVSAASGYIIDASQWKAFIAIPTLFIAMAALWAVECNRMVRATYYIGYVLWPEICALISRSNADGWEIWIRLSEGNEGSFRRWQHLLQCMVIIIVPIIFSMVAIVISASDFKKDPSLSVWPVLFFGAVIIVIWGILFSLIRKVSDLAATIPDYGPETRMPNQANSADAKSRTAD